MHLFRREVQRAKSVQVRYRLDLSKEEGRIIDNIGSEWEIESVDPKGWMMFRLINTTTKSVPDPQTIVRARPNNEEHLNDRVEPLSEIITVPFTSKALDTQIRISRETRDMLEELGSMHDNYDDVIRKLITFYKGVARPMDSLSMKEGSLSLGD